MALLFADNQFHKGSKRVYFSTPCMTHVQKGPPHVDEAHYVLLESRHNFARRRRLLSVNRAILLEVHEI